MNMENLLFNGAALRNPHSVAILGLLAVCSVIGLTLIVERALYFWRIKIEPEATLLRIRASVLAGRIEEALSILGDVKGNPVLAVIAAGVRSSLLPKEQAAEMMRVCQLKQKAAMEKHLVVLGTLGNTAPFIGLLGTVLGIIQAFHDLAGAQAAANGANVVAVGIAEALVATAAGLSVAIPSVVFYNVFLKQAKAVLTEMDVASSEVLALLSPQALEARARGPREN